MLLATKMPEKEQSQHDDNTNNITINLTINISHNTNAVKPYWP